MSADVVSNATTTCVFSRSICNFGKFLWCASLLIDLVAFVPQAYKLHRKRRYQNVANGLSLCWLALVICSQAGTWRWFAVVQNEIDAKFAVVMEVWLFLTAVAMMCYTMVLSETHFDYQRPITLAATLVASAAIVVISILNKRSASAMKDIAGVLGMVQIYPQLLLSELLSTSKAVSVWTVFLLELKYSMYFFAQFFVYTSTEEFTFAYMTSCMLSWALINCFAYPIDVRALPGSNDISRSQFTVLPASSSSQEQPSNQPQQQAGIDGFFSIDDFDANEFDNTPVNLPTVTTRRDGHRTTFGCFSWYTLRLIVALWALLLTVMLIVKVRKFTIIFPPLCIILLIVSVFSVKHFLPERMLTLVKFIL